MTRNSASFFAYRISALLLVPAAILLLGTCGARRPNASPDSGISMWQSSVPIVVRNAERLGEEGFLRFEQELESASGRQVLSQRSAAVSIWTFDRFERVPLNDIDYRFDSLDPRVDPFVRTVSDLFRARWDGANAEIIYLLEPDQSTEAGGRGSRRIEDALDHSASVAGVEHSDVRLLSIRRAPTRVVAGVAVAIAAMGLLFPGPRRLRRLIIAVIMVPAGFLGGVSVVLAPVWAAVIAQTFQFLAVGYRAPPTFYLRERVLHRPVETGQYRRTALLRTFGRLATGIAVAIVASTAILRSESETGALLPLFLGVVVVSSGIAFAPKLRWSVPEHRLFVPVELIEPRKEFRSVAIMVVAVALTTLPLLSAPSANGHNIIAPLPHSVQVGESADELPVTGAAVTGAGIAERTRYESEFPSDRTVELSYASYVAHRAFQESIAYRREWSHDSFSVPRLGDAVERDRFEPSNGGFRKWRETVVQFDEQWFLDHYLYPVDEVGYLLGRHPGPMQVRQTAVRDRGIPASDGLRLVVTQLLLAFLVLLDRLFALHPGQTPSLQKVRAIVRAGRLDRARERSARRVAA